MPFAVIGVRREARRDDETAVCCMRDGFDSYDLALAFMREQQSIAWREVRDIYIQGYTGDRWTPEGGQCYVYALRTLVEEGNRLPRGVFGKMPVLVHGYCRRFKIVQGVEVASGHAWIEGNEWVLDCGSYIPRQTRHKKKDYYKEKDVACAYPYTRDVAIDHHGTFGRPFPWEPPPKEFARERSIWDLQQREA